MLFIDNMPGMKVYLNDQEVHLESQTSVELLLKDNGVRNGGTAIALNGEVVPKSNWSETTLNDGDKLVVITATAGG